jgi:hypothetical protein
MNLTTYGNVGIALLWMGVASIVMSIILFLVSSKGISIGDPEGLHQHDTYFILFSWGHRVILLLPLLAGMLLVFTGLQARSQASAIASEVKRIEEAEQAGAPNP